MSHALALCEPLQEPCNLANPKDPARLVMFYSGVQATNRNLCFIGKGWALKPDPFTWHQDEHNPVFGQFALLPSQPVVAGAEWVERGELEVALDFAYPSMNNGACVGDFDRTTALDVGQILTVLPRAVFDWVA